MERKSLRKLIGEAKSAAKAASMNPRKNPAGKNPYVGSVRVIRDEIIVKPAPDAAHSARLRGMESRKSRGTSSSSTRKIIK